MCIDLPHGSVNLHVHQVGENCVAGLSFQLSPCSMKTGVWLMALDAPSAVSSLRALSLALSTVNAYLKCLHLYRLLNARAIFATIHLILPID
jgi:hypothetical protein